MNKLLIETIEMLMDYDYRANNNFSKNTFFNTTFRNLLKQEYDLFNHIFISEFIKDLYSDHLDYFDNPGSISEIFIEWCADIIEYRKPGLIDRLEKEFGEIFYSKIQSISSEDKYIWIMKFFKRSSYKVYTYTIDISFFYNISVRTIQNNNTHRPINKKRLENIKTIIEFLTNVYHKEKISSQEVRKMFQGDFVHKLDKVESYYDLRDIFKSIYKKYLMKDRLYHIFSKDPEISFVKPPGSKFFEYINVYCPLVTGTSSREEMTELILENFKDIVDVICYYITKSKQFKESELNTNYFAITSTKLTPSNILTMTFEIKKEIKEQILKGLNKKGEE